MRPHHRLTHPRALHPGAWWLWALGLAAAATRTVNPVPLLLVIAVTWFVVSARREQTPWASAYSLFFKLAMAVIAIHVVFQVLLSRHAEGLTVLFTLPELPMPDSTGIKIGGAVTLEAVLTALYFALQLAAIFCCIGAANALGSARRLLRYTPSALHELGLAVVVALTFAPQLVVDARRVHEAARLRGGRGGRIRRFGRLAMPVIEGSLERSVDLAAAMESRGYGRTTDARPRLRVLSATLVCLGSLAAVLGVYGVLTGAGWHWTGTPALLLGLALGTGGLVVAGRRVRRTRYRPDAWALPEVLVVLCGAAAIGLTSWQVRRDPGALVLPSLTELPPVPLLACAGILVAALPAFLAPPPRATGNTSGDNTEHLEPRQGTLR